MKTKVLIAIFCLALFLGGCACGGGGCHGHHYHPYYYYPCYYPHCGNYCTDCYNKAFYYSHCDNDWHNPLCGDKLYSYVKTKRIDFPIDYRTKYEECCLPVAPVHTCVPGRC